MLRFLLWSLFAAFLALVGAVPALAVGIGSLLLAALLLVVHGLGLMLGLPAIQILIGLAAVVWAARTRRLA